MRATEPHPLGDVVSGAVGRFRRVDGCPPDDIGGRGNREGHDDGTARDPPAAGRLRRRRHPASAAGACPACRVAPAGRPGDGVGRVRQPAWAALRARSGHRVVPAGPQLAAARQRAALGDQAAGDRPAGRRRIRPDRFRRHRAAGRGSAPAGGDPGRRPGRRHRHRPRRRRRLRLRRPLSGTGLLGVGRLGPAAEPGSHPPEPAAPAGPARPDLGGPAGLLGGHRGQGRGSDPGVDLAADAGPARPAGRRGAGRPLDGIGFPGRGRGGRGADQPGLDGAGPVGRPRRRGCWIRAPCGSRGLWHGEQETGTTLAAVQAFADGLPRWTVRPAAGSSAVLGSWTQILDVASRGFLGSD